MELGNPGFDRGVVDATYAIDGKNGNYTGELRQGTLMAQITTSKLWVPCKRTRVNGAVSSSESIVVDDARAFKVGDTITIGATSGLTITAVDYDNDEITVDSDAVDAADNAVVIASGALAGAETCRGVLDEHVDLYDVNTRANVDRAAGRIVTSNAKINTAALLGDLDSCRASGVTNYLSHLQFYTNGVQV